jgi:hypothetical protein
MKNYINKIYSTVWGKVILAILILIIGFLGGMEYKAYQIRRAIGDAFSTSFGEEKSTVTNKKNESNNLSKQVDLNVLEKKFSEVDFMEYIVFKFEFINSTEKDIEGVKGNIVFKDLFGDQIQKVSLSYDEGIKAGESVFYKASIDYNKYISDDVKLEQTELSKLKYDWNIETIIYTDGTQENF